MIPLPPDLPVDLARGLTDPPPSLASFLTQLHYEPLVGSTNDVAASLARSGAPEGTVVIADGQTAGRGRHGRTWQSHAGDGLYMSVVFRPLADAAPGPEAAPGPGVTPGPEVTLRPEVTPRPEVTLLTLMAGTAAFEAIRRQGVVRAEIKWPNDIVVTPTHGGAWRKLAGILAEATVVGRDIEYIVLGIGVNLRTPTVPDLRNIATSVEEERGSATDRGALVRDLADGLARGRAELREGRVETVLRAWRAAAPSSRGRRVTWREGGQACTGVTLGIDQSGHLRVEADGREHVLAAGEIQWV